MKLLLNILLFLLYAACSGTGLIVLKIAVAEKPSGSFWLMQVLLQFKFLIGFFLYACGFLLWMYILSKFDLNVAFPIAMSLFFIVSSLGSYLILQETFGLYRILGIILCFGGILLVIIK